MKICVAVATRERREMLENALRSLLQMDQIPGVEIVILVVENGPFRTLEDLVAELRVLHPHFSMAYVLEQRLGIASARNAALDYSINAGFDRLAFIDDDEIVHHDWLAKLHRTQCDQGLHLVGGPARAFIRTTPGGWKARSVWRGYVARTQRVERVATKLAERGRGDRITLATNNWMVDLDFCRSHALRFDTRYNFSGGEDTDFFRAAQRVGGKTGWSPRAVVEEEIPLERLLVRYQFMRAFNQSIVSFHRKYGSESRSRQMLVLGSILCRIIAGTVFLIAIPLTGGATMLQSIRIFGFAAGRLAGIAGYHGNLYKNPTGD